jgi:hypothetical protein
MFNYYTGLLGVFAIIFYVIIIDKNVADFIILCLKALRVNVSRTIFYIKIYPRLRLDTFLLKRQMGKVTKSHEQMAKSIIDDLNSKSPPGP